MGATEHLKTRVSLETKRRVQLAAQAQLLTESIWLRQAIDAALKRVDDGFPGEVESRVKAPSKRLYVRLRPDDVLLLRERAAARGMPPATYLSVLARSHLRQVTPLPKSELQALKQSVGQLGAIGRNVNQLVRLVHEGRAPSLGAKDLSIFLKVCEALRDHVKGLVKANLVSWESGHVESRD